METKFILSMNDFNKYCQKKKDELNYITGQCDKCSQKKVCMLENKEFHIDGLLHMSTMETRFPKLLDLLQNNPNIPYSIPATIYKSVYGLYQQTFSCPFNTALILNSFDKLEKIYNLLLDKTSQKVFLNLLMYRLTHNRDYVLRAYSMEPQYFISTFRGLSSNQVYVDCGAYNGDSFINYCQYNDVPKVAYLFEPDSKNYNFMNHSLQAYRKLCKINLIKKGAYKFTGSLYFDGGKGVNSRLLETPVKNSTQLSVTSIDDVIAEDITFIKMDIEGAEKEALLGAEKHIFNNYPKLAISIYHFNDDLWEIPLMIKSKFPKYENFQIRHHSKFNSETVLYVY